MASAWTAIGIGAALVVATAVAVAARWLVCYGAREATRIDVEVES